jgi:hypothetical protein
MKSGVSPLPVLVHDLGDDSQAHDLGAPTVDSPQTQYSISTQTLTTVAIDELRHYRCFETPQGWVLALDPASSHTFLWRPQDGERIQLAPKEHGFPERCKCLLSDMPAAASGCAVAVFDLDHPQMWVCNIGAADSDWYSHRCEPTMFLKAGDIPPMMTNIAKCHAIAAVGGKIYFELTAYQLGVIEFVFDAKEGLGLKLATIEVDMVDLPLSMPMASMYLVESCGDLFLVVIFFDGDNVHKIAKHALYKMDLSQPAWCEVDEIGRDRVFLLGGDSIGISCFGASCSAGDRLPGNCIYFLNHMATTDNFLHVIDLKKGGTQQVRRPFRHNGYLMPLRPPFWLLPTDHEISTDNYTNQPQGLYFHLCNLWRSFVSKIYALNLNLL